jgi:hypothetical protein
MIFEVNLSRAVIGSNVEFVTEFGERSLGEVVGIHGNKCLAITIRQGVFNSDNLLSGNQPLLEGVCGA